MTVTGNIILNHQQIQHKTRRIAYQILESNVNEEEIIIAGIANNGFIFAQKIKVELEKITDATITLCEVKVDKQNPLQNITTSLSKEDYTNKPLVLIDDVLNSGTTLIYGVRHFLDVPLKNFKTAVLVNRNHKKYPIKADFKGISLSTSIQEHIDVVFAKENDTAYLV
ncbi:phosphoribosyltransferase family protein [Kordia algicida OT-1]|uniref:Uracil phosphoribosyltransferase/pyrimidine operon attenuation protein n=1 Tax=Kordia algicida OT-1 TaxID=391587 RepID=A9E5L7_9FLAO|nr:phosphoribosyltransferase family protein [Kordia algicida]EDP95196.1 uracil phosphoribosyltransferase/pyrimidine operon attenuation protein [Kordia algicida OT-1]